MILVAVCLMLSVLDSLILFLKLKLLIGNTILVYVIFFLYLSSV